MQPQELASKVVEYMALARELKINSNQSEYTRANRLSWELAIWLPSDLYRSMVKAIVSPDDATNVLTVLMDVRKLSLGAQAGNLTSNDIAQHAPGIGQRGKR